jgi:hypothetical protein
MAEVATNRPQDRLLYQGQVRSQLEQMGDLGEVNLYESLPGDATGKRKPSKVSSEERPWVHPQILVVSQAVKEAWAADLQRP